MGIYSYAYNAAKKALRGKNVTPGQAIKKTKVGTKLAFKRSEQDKFIKFRDDLHTSAKFDTETRNKLKSKAPLTKVNKGKSEIVTPKEPKLAKGGRVGLKRGTGLMRRKSNIQKIQETFGPGKSNPKKSAAKKKKFPDLTGDGKVTFADILKGRGVKRG
jgi:hypothetical protein